MYVKIEIKSSLTLWRFDSVIETLQSSNKTKGVSAGKS